MKIRKLGALFAALCVVGAAGSAQAETDEVVLARQFGIGYLPLTVMNTKHLVKKHLAADGLTDTNVTWKRVGSGSEANDVLLAGKLDYASGGQGPGVFLWDKSHGNFNVHGVAALSQMQNF